MEVSLDGKVAIVTGAGPNIGGLANFVRAAAMDLAPYGIRVNSFSPAAPRPAPPRQALVLPTCLPAAAGAAGPMPLIPLDDTVIDDEA